jgi:hypothetical protein
LRTVLATLGLGFLGAALTGGASAAMTPLAAGLAGGVAGNLATDLFKHLDRKVCERFLDGWSGIDENHHVVAALRLAQIDALRALIAKFEGSLGKEDDRLGDQAGFGFAARVKSFLAEETKVAQARSFSAESNELEARKAVIARLPDTFDDALAARRNSGERGDASSAIAQVRSVVEIVVLDELRTRCGDTSNRIPQAFEGLFLGKEGTAGWFDLFVRDAADKLTHPNSEFAAIWNAEQISIVKQLLEAQGRSAEETRKILHSMSLDFKEHLDNINISISALSDSLREITDYSVRLDTILSHFGYSEGTKSQIRNLVSGNGNTVHEREQLIGSIVVAVAKDEIPEDELAGAISAGLDTIKDIKLNRKRLVPSISASKFVDDEFAKYADTMIENAVLERDYDLIAALAKRGADINTEDVAYGSLGFLLICECDVPEIGPTEKTLRALYRAGYDPNLTDMHGMNILFESVYMDYRSPLTELSLDAGANVNHRDKENATPLMLASRFLEARNARILLERGADPNLIDDEGNTALVCAIEVERWAGPADWLVDLEQGIIDYLVLLRDFGATVYVPHRGARNPVAVAKENNMERVVLFLNSWSEKN